MSRRFWMVSLTSYFASAKALLGISPTPAPARLRAVREAVEVYELERSIAVIDNEADDRYDRFFPARDALIQAIRALRPGESIPKDGINYDPVYFQSATVDGVVYAVSYDYRMNEWVVQDVPTFLGPVEA
jgi:hypothetical protein